MIRSDELARYAAADAAPARRGFLSAVILEGGAVLGFLAIAAVAVLRLT